MFKKIFFVFVFDFVFCFSNNNNNNNNFFDLKCDSNSILNSLEISTNLNENEIVSILNNCKINKNFLYSKTKEFYGKYSKNVYDEKSNFRAMKFSFNPINNKFVNEKININLELINNINNDSITKKNFVLYSNENYETFIEYNNNNKNYLNWYKIVIKITINNNKENPILIQFYKINNKKYKNNKDFSFLFLNIIIFFTIYLNFNYNFRSTIEIIILRNYHEIRNPENLFIMSIVLIIILISLYTIDFLNIFIYFVLIFVIPLSVSMLFEGVSKNFKEYVKLGFNNKFYEISFVEKKISFNTILSFLLGIFFLFLWIFTKNWFVCDLLAIGISLVSIRIFRFTNSKFLITIFVMTIIYNIIWINKYSKTFRGEIRYFSKNNVNFPIRIIFPETKSNPFESFNSFPISDIVFPGFFLCYCKKFDTKKKMNLYLKFGLISLGIGLVFNVIIFYGYGILTSSFLFTGPFILIVVLYFTFVHEDFDEFLNGFKSTEVGKHFEEKMLENNVEKKRKETIKSEESEYVLKEEEYFPNKNNNVYSSNNNNYEDEYNLIRNDNNEGKSYEMKNFDKK